MAKALAAAIILVIVLSHHLPEQKHFIVLAPVACFFFWNGWTMLILVPKLHDVEATAVHIKMDVALFEIRRYGFPNLDFGMQFLNSLPSRLTDALAVDFGQDKQQFNSFFATVQEEYANLFGLDIVASVRRLGLITFRLAMILTTLRLMDGKEKSDIIVCDDTDFRTVLIMARVLLQHTAHVLGTLPAIDNSSASKSQPANRQLFFDMLPHDFNRSTYLAIAAQLNIPPKTAEKQISRLCAHGQLTRISQGNYRKRNFY